MRQFRVIMWPGKQIEIPSVAIWDVTVEDRAGEFGGPFLIFGELRDHRRPPEELYLRELRNLDVQSVDAVAGFCAEYGRLGLPSWQEIHTDRPLFTFEMDRLRDSYLPHAPADPRRPSGHVHPNLVVPLAEAAAYATLMRDMTRVWQFHVGELAFEELIEQWENPFFPRNEKGQHLNLATLDAKMAHVLLVENLGYALSAFRVRPLLLIEEDDGRILENDAGQGDRSLYAALCLQLANHIAEGAVYRKCRKCGSLFFRQRGRARYDQYRAKGRIDYCSRECAHAAAQKTYQGRKEEAARLHKEGLSTGHIATRMDRTETTISRWLAEGEEKGTK